MSVSVLSWETLHVGAVLWQANKFRKLACTKKESPIDFLNVYAGILSEGEQKDIQTEAAQPYAAQEGEYGYGL